MGNPLRFFCFHTGIDALLPQFAQIIAVWSILSREV